MPGFLDRLGLIKDKAAFEAEKLRETTNLQSQIRSLQKEIEQSFATLGATTYRLYREGNIQQPELQKACASLAALQEQIEQYEREIEALRSKDFEEPVRPICPNGHGELPLDNRFCHVCGAEAVKPPTEEKSTVFCTQCGSAIASDSHFCSECGTQVSAGPPSTRMDNQYGQKGDSPQPPPRTPVDPVTQEGKRTDNLSKTRSGRTCPNCGAETSPSNQWCIYCGAALDEGETAAADTTLTENATTQLSETETERTTEETESRATTLLPETDMEPQGEEPPRPTSNATTLLPETLVDEPAKDESAAGSRATTLLPETGEEEGDDSVASEEAPDSCSACGAEVVAGNAFCIHCGHPVGS